MELKKLTWDDFPNPCYSPQERYGDFNGTILDILKDNRIPDEDKIWAATRPNILDDKTLRLFACKCVREVWHLLTDERSRNAVDVAERYANGQATDEELAASWTAARDDARAAKDARDARDARDAASAALAAASVVAWASWAAWDAASSAASSASWAAWDAASSAAWAASWAAASDAAWVKQVNILIELIEKP